MSSAADLTGGLKHLRRCDLHMVPDHNYWNPATSVAKMRDVRVRVDADVG